MPKREMLLLPTDLNQSDDELAGAHAFQRPAGRGDSDGGGESSSLSCADSLVMTESPSSTVMTAPSSRSSALTMPFGVSTAWLS